MKDGHFLEQFFDNNGGLGEPNTRGEYTVLCPFEHDKGYELNPSAHLNLKKGVFHCKTCRAEQRFGNGGLSEVQFISEYYGVSEADAILMRERLDGDEDPQWDIMMENLWKTPHHMEMLHQRRGLTLDTIKEYQLGYSGDGVLYPVFIFKELLDVRTYDPDMKPKVRSRKGATTLMFPFDHWRSDDRPTLLVGGENDALLGRQIGFNALTFTGGEGAVPEKVWLKQFRGKIVYVMYDADAAGRMGARTVAFRLREAGAEVFIVEWGDLLTGEKDDKDLSDFVLKHGKGYADVSELMSKALPFSEKLYTEEKNKVYPLVELWEASAGKNQSRRLSSRVVMSGKYDMDMHVPTLVRFTCKHEDDPDHDAEKCPIHKKPKTWVLNENNLKHLLYLVDVKETEQTKELYNLNYLSLKEECLRMDILSSETVQKVILTPDVETESDVNGFRSVEQYAYLLGDRMNDGDRYRVFYKAYPHPKDGQKVYLVIDKIEESDNAVNTFKVTEALKEKLSVFQGNPFQMMSKRFEMAKGIVKGFTTDMMVWGTDLVYHSPLEFSLWGRSMKGYPEVAIIGESRTGKTDTAVKLQTYYRLGNRIALKGATVAGILGGADKASSGGFRIKWGIVPRNDKGLLILDEMSGVHSDVMAQLTDMRSSGEATITKIVSTKAPARTRMLWIGNPRVINNRSKSLLDYPSGVDAVLDLVGADEDVARFDAVMLVVDRGNYARPDEFSKDSQPHPQDVYVDLIRWIWSRSPEQITFDDSVGNYIWDRSLILNESYATDIKLLGAEASKKLARFAVACAACCYSCDETGEKLVVKKEHVDWAEMFINRCYDDDVFKLKEYVKERNKSVRLTKDVEAVLHGCMSVNKFVVLAREIYHNTEPIPRQNLQAMAGLQNEEFNQVIGYLSKYYLIKNESRGISATRTFRLAYQSYQEVKMKPIAERGL